MQTVHQLLLTDEYAAEAQGIVIAENSTLRMLPFIVGVNLTKFEGKDELFVRPPDHSKMPLRSRPPLTDDLRKPLLPIRARRLPTQLPLGLRVRARPSLGHHDHQVLPAHQANHPSGYRSRLLRSEHHRQSGQPGTYLCGLIIDDVVDTS